MPQSDFIIVNMLQTIEAHMHRIKFNLHSKIFNDLLNNLNYQAKMKIQYSECYG